MLKLSSPALSVRIPTSNIAVHLRRLDLHIPLLKDVDEMIRKIKQRPENTRAGDWIVQAGG